MTLSEVGIGRPPVVRISYLDQAVFCIIGERGRPVQGVGDGERVALGIVRNLRQVAFGVADAGHLIEGRLVRKCRRRRNGLLRAREQIPRGVVGHGGVAPAGRVIVSVN